jgi:succinate-semialdehyde dehydrogenase/glutarate-semialdehyde dehydrogenase
MNFVEPTIIENIKKDMRIFSEEIFGPVAALMKFKTEAEAISLANELITGWLRISILEISVEFLVLEQIECGILGVNENVVSNEMAPFGGIKAIRTWSRGI